MQQEYRQEIQNLFCSRNNRIVDRTGIHQFGQKFGRKGRTSTT